MSSIGVLDRTLSQGDLLLGLACSVVLSVVTPDTLNYDVVDLGPLIPEWGAADARLAPASELATHKKVTTPAQPTAPIA